MEKTLVKCTQLTEHRETTKCERDGGSGSGSSSKRAKKSGTSNNDFRKLGKGFDPGTILLVKNNFWKNMTKKNMR